MKSGCSVIISCSSARPCVRETKRRDESSHGERERESPGAHCATAEEEDGGRAGRASMLGRTRIHLLRDERSSVRDPACPCVRACVCVCARARPSSCRTAAAQADVVQKAERGGRRGHVWRSRSPDPPTPANTTTLTPAIAPPPHPPTSPLSASPSDASAARISARVKRVTAARLVGVAPARLGEEKLSAAPHDGCSPPAISTFYFHLGLFPSD